MARGLGRFHLILLSDLLTTHKRGGIAGWRHILRGQQGVQATTPLRHSSSISEGA